MKQHGIGLSAGFDLAELAMVIVEDIGQLTVLHDKELSCELITALQDVNFPKNLGLCLGQESSRVATEQAAESISTLKSPADSKTLDDLAADFADIYLNYSFRVSPLESVWLDEDNLTHQQPMFEIRDCFRRHGLAAENWRIRSEDHLVLQLQFLVYLANRVVESPHHAEELLIEMADFLDKHLLLWLDDFALTVSSRCSTGFYASVAVFTAAYINELRGQLVILLPLPEPAPEQDVLSDNQISRTQVEVNFENVVGSSKSS